MSGDQEKLNEAMKRHLELMKTLAFLLKYVCCLALMFAGGVFMVRTNGNFGDVPLVLGVYWFLKTVSVRGMKGRREEQWPAFALPGLRRGDLR
jgi:hypothetical protein